MKLSPHRLRLILVTGCPRSGTTAAGALLGLASGAGVLHEPCSPRAGITSLDEAFPIPGVDLSAEQLHRLTEDVRALRLTLKRGIYPREHWSRRLVRRVIGGRTRISLLGCSFNPRLRTLIWKDPMACLAAPWLAAHENLDVVWCLRNPYAVAASFKRMQWGERFESLAARLARLNPAFVPPDFDARSAMPAHKAAVLWRATYSHLLERQRRGGRCHCLPMDALVQSPENTGAQLYQALHLPYTDHVRRRVAATYQPRQAPAMPPDGVAHASHRDLSRVNDYWQELLTGEERDYVERQCGELWRQLSRMNAVTSW